MKLNNLLAERTWLAGLATDAVLGGRAKETKAGVKALNDNSADFGVAIGAIYTKKAQSEFLSLVRLHTSTLVAYATHVTSNNTTKASATFDKLVASGDDVAMFFVRRTPNLNKAAVMDAFKAHNIDLRNVVDAQAAKDKAKKFSTLRNAYANVHAIADTVAAGIIEQFPDRFGGKFVANSSDNMPAGMNMPMSGSEADGQSAPDLNSSSSQMVATPSLLDKALMVYSYQQAQNVQQVQIRTANNTKAMPSDSPLRIVIPAIKLDAPIVAVSLKQVPDVTKTDRTHLEMLIPDFRAAGWLNTSSKLGGAGNLVLGGHHNVSGRVFENLKDVALGEKITVVGPNRTVTYVVIVSEIRPEKDQPEYVRAENARLIESTADTRLTLVTCWPPDSNTHRLVVIAKPVSSVVADTQHTGSR